MQIIKITSSSLLSLVVTCEMVAELAASSFVGMSPEQIRSALNSDLKKPSKNMANLPCAKLRTIVAKKLTDNPDIPFASGEFEFEFNCLPDIELDINEVGKNKVRKVGNKRPVLTGNYRLSPKGRDTLRKVQENDPGRWEIVKHILENSAFEQLFKVAPTKAIKKVGSITTPSVEMSYSIKSGWVIPFGDQ